MIPKPTHYVNCSLCGVQVNPIMSRYLYCLLGWRGRPVPRPLVKSAVMYCGPCGDFIVKTVGPFLTRVQREGVMVK